MAPDRWVVLDDIDPSIKYTGSWFQDFSESQDKVGNYGPPYRRTLHGTSADATVEFVFNGTAIEVWGTNIVKDFDTNPDPTFECFVDNVSIGRDTVFQFDENNWRFCRKVLLPDAHHTLRIDVKVASKDQTFWLDQLRYLPSPNLPLDNRVILFDNTDPAIHYDSQWMKLGDTANMTTQKNSVAQVNFVGTSVSWVAFVPTELPHTGATGTWAIDGGKETQFLLSGLPATGTPTIYNQFYFTTPEVEAGPHTLTVTFLGDNQTTPLSIDFLYVKNGTFPLPTTTVNNTTTPTATPTATPDPNPHNDRGLNVSAILGGVLGGLAFLLVVGAIHFWTSRKIKQRERFVKTKVFEYTPTPFDPYRKNHPTPTAQVRQPQLYAAPGVSAPKETALSPTPPAQQQPSRMRKQRETPGRTATTRHTNNKVRQIGRPSATDTSAVRQHTDSGLRLSRHPVMDIPPHYTPD